MENNEELAGHLDMLFNPGSVAVVGVSQRMENPGTLIIRSIIDMGYSGRLYPVNPKYDEILGLRCYPSVTSIDHAPDVALLSVPPDSVPGILEECSESGVGVCVIITAGFGELGTETGLEREAAVKRVLEGSPMRVVGPNCLGLYSARGGLALFAGQRPDEGGTVSVISQSGSIASMTYMLGKEHGLGFSKMVSSGNEIDLNCADYLQYLAQDEETRIITAYLEQVRDPRRFLDAAVSIKGRKPFLVWRAGLTEKGRQAASSHTGAMTGSEDIWLAAAEQAGITLVQGLGDTVDTAAAFYHLPPPAGRRVCIVSPPGGIGVDAADTAQRYGLEMPPLAPETEARLREILPGEGTGFNNPVDMGFGSVVEGNVLAVLNTVAADPSVDIVMVVGGAPASREGDFGLMQMHASEIKAAGKETDKPVVAIGIPSGFAFGYLAELNWAGIPAYQSAQDACRVLRRFVDFHGI